MRCVELGAVGGCGRWHFALSRYVGHRWDLWLTAALLTQVLPVCSL